MTARSSSPWADARAARPLRWWPEAALARADSGCVTAWNAWCAQWGVAAGTVRARNAGPEDGILPAGAWRRIASLPAWLSVDSTAPESVRDALRSMLFGSSTPASPIAEDVATASLDDLGRVLERVLAFVTASGSAPEAGDSPPSVDARRWSGAVRVRLEATGRSGPVAFALHCSAPAAEALCGAAPARATAPRGGLASVVSAMGALPVTLKVELAPTTLTLGTLQSLRIGDVLPLSHRLDQPLRVADPAAPLGAPPFCSAYLGRRAGYRAVELVPLVNASSQAFE